MIDKTAKASATGISFEYADQRKNKTSYLPMRVAVIAQGETSANSSYNTEPWLATSYGEAAKKYGPRSPIALSLYELKPPSGGGVGGIEVMVYPLKNHASGAVATGSVTPSGTLTAPAELKLRIGGEESATFKVPQGTVVAATLVPAMLAACAQNPRMPALLSGTTVLNMTSPWMGASANNIKIEVLGNTQGGVFTIVQPTGGTNNPDVAPALAQIGPRWETLILNQMEVGDSATLDKYVAWGEPRWNALLHKFGVVLTGTVATDRAVSTGITNARKTDRQNLIVSFEGSANLPFVLIAKLLASVAPSANNSPASDFGLLPVVRAIPGATAVQFDHGSRDVCVKAGLATTEYRDNQMVISDLVTCYHPDGEDPAPYSSLCDIIKLMNFANLLDMEFNHRRWRGCPIIADDQSTDEPRARRLSDVVKACYKVTNAAARMAIVANPKFINANTTAQIDPGNPKRVNVYIPPPLSANANIMDLRVAFSFYFGD